MILQERKIKSFQKKILDWYLIHKRDLPWREVPDCTSLEQRAYRVLVSEIMLQQTQVSRVIPKYEAWLQAFPTIGALAKAQTSEVLRLWSGLGYNRRALYLQKTARVLVEQCNGIWPESIEALKKLPGVGEYTARAVACFAFDQQVAVVDTNVRKVILLEVFREPKETKGPEETKVIQEIADTLLPTGHASDWNQALMDYSSAVLAKEKIVIPKQSRFQGSTRYYRGKLVKMLLQKERVEEEKVQFLLHDEHMPESMNFQDILQSLEKEGFIRREKGIIELVK